jgi:hypothetical protein
MGLSAAPYALDPGDPDLDRDQPATRDVVQDPEVTMNRKAFDKILTAIGAVLTIGLVAAGSLLVWGHSYANDQVKTQLVAQKIFFPPKGDAYEPQNQVGKYIEQYAGQQLTTGAQAKAYADHFIAFHLKEAAEGKTYAEVSNELIALQASDPKSPEIATLTAQKDTLFRGESLRGMLLNAYGWWKMGQLALWGAVFSFIAAAVMLFLTILGAVHLRRVSPDVEIFVDLPKTSTQSSVAVS